MKTFPPMSKCNSLARRSFLARATAMTLGGALPGLVRATSLPSLKPVVPGVLTIAMDGDMPCTGIKDGKIIGADGEMISLVANRLGLVPKPALMDWASTIESVRTGRADVTLGNMGWTAARAQIVALTDALYFTAHYVLTRSNMLSVEKVGLADLRGHSVGTLTGVTIVGELKRIPGTTDVKLYDTSDACIADVRAGRLDFAFLDGPIVGYMIQQNPTWNLKLIPITPFDGFKVLGTKQYSVIGMNGENPDLFDAVNAGVKWLWRTKENTRILQKYGMTSSTYLVPPTSNPRVGIDRDGNDAVSGRWAHNVKDFSASFAAAAT
ncbi:substrate-binding periplasmic protein [Paraburkholderia caribensis]|uniref:substrate-binding periplasmic protein n=1 Tax=Paraburkholderia caribensis TaxID=75105 RepID=UPI0007219EFF|nr:transporter substrate-binding domain-containing protein [Paraburkholderia caribensis]ALP68565.1 hypothetical protein AN416_38240 [Paraburkholderia caribensis]